VTAAGPAAAAAGDTLGPLRLTVMREDLVRYAGASGDFNPIHWSERFAVGVGLPNVIAHGMLTMALGGQLVTAWAGDPAAVVGYSVRFTRPVVVPDDDDGVVVELTGKVKSVEVEGDARIATVAVTASVDGKAVLGRAIARVRLAS
jgi:acyl dehydratase